MWHLHSKILCIYKENWEICQLCLNKAENEEAFKEWQNKIYNTD